MKRKFKSALRIDTSSPWKLESMMRFMSDVSFYCPRGYKFKMDVSIGGDCVFHIENKGPNGPVHCCAIKEILQYEKKISRYLEN